MGSSQTIPIAGIVLASVTIAALIILGVDPIISASVLTVWVGSLFLAAGRTVEPPAVVVEQPMSVASMRKLVENSSTPMLVTEGNSIAAANRTARKMLGQHIIGQDARVAFRQPDAISLFAQESNGSATIRGLVRRQDIWRINRQEIEEDLAIIELINQTAEADISRAHTDFVANASHELRTPLAAILGYAETLNENADNLDSPTSKKFLVTIQREAQRLQSLISDLMSLSRVEAEKHDAPRKKIALAEVVERAARDAAGSNRIEQLALELTTNPYVKGDSSQLEQVIRNLVENALKYGEEGSTVTVKLDGTREGEARICVQDQGEGIAPEHLPHLTRRFYRTDPGRSRASGGTGLGLAIVKHIVERHKGRLDIESELGKGTLITVRMPTTKVDPSPSGISMEPLVTRVENEGS